MIYYCILCILLVFFRVIHSQQLVLCDEFKQNAIFKHIKESVYYGPDIEDILLKVATSLQVTVLQSKILKQKLIVGNTHLYYHPDANQVRIVQVAIITTFLNHLKEKFKQVSYIMCRFNLLKLIIDYFRRLKKKLQ